MLVVAIFINNKPIYSRTAVRVMQNKEGRSLYKLDDGSKVAHHEEDGVVELAKKMLNTIKEVK